MRSRVLSVTLIAAGLLAAPRPSAAQGYFEVGGFGSHTRFDPSLPWSGANSGGARLSFGSGGGLGSFVLEGEGAYFSLASSALPDTRYIPARARLLYAPTFGPVSVLMGGGGVRNQFQSTGAGGGSASEWGYTGLAGVRLGLGSYLALRVEAVMDYITHPAVTTGVQRNTNRTAQAGLSIPLWMGRREAPAKPARAPKVAEQPTQPTPTRKATPAAEPAPKTPVALASREKRSAADADRDGVADASDLCSNTPAGGIVDATGCSVYRDSDADGVTDQKDACPATRSGETVDGRGCAVSDTDGDGVPNMRDRCEGTPAGTPVNSVGCAVETAATPAAPGACAAPLFKGTERTITLRGVNFEPTKEELTPASLAVLDDVAVQLIDAPTVRIEVGGHTDARGGYGRNLRLSLARAESVRAYLVMRGVPSGQLTARGYGSAHPIATNGTRTGRAMNRRVELRRID